MRLRLVLLLSFCFHAVVSAIDPSRVVHNETLLAALPHVVRDLVDAGGLEHWLYARGIYRSSVGSSPQTARPVPGIFDPTLTRLLRGIWLSSSGCVSTSDCPQIDSYSATTSPRTGF